MVTATGLSKSFAMGTGCQTAHGMEAPLKTLRTEYDGVMVYLCQQSTLTPWQWCNSWPQTAPQQKVDMKQKSPFHVVLRNNDYHGAVAPNDYLRTILNAWGVFEWPVTLSMTAIQHNGQQLAVVLCWSRLDKSHLAKLDFMKAQAAKMLAPVMKAKGVQERAEPKSAAKPEATKPEASQPETTKPETSKTDTTAKPAFPKPASPKPAAPKLATPHPVAPKVAPKPPAAPQMPAAQKAPPQQPSQQLKTPKAA